MIFFEEYNETMKDLEPYNETMKDMEPYNETMTAEEDYELSFYEFMTDGVILFIVCLFGIIGNLFAFLVLSQPQMKLPIHCYLQFLAVYDTLFLVCKVAMHVVYVFSFKDDVIDSLYSLMYPGALSFFSVLIYIVRMGSIWTTVGVSLERYFVVCHPLKALSFCTYKRTILFNLLIAFLVLCFNVPHFFANKVTYEFDPDINETVGVLISSDFGDSDFFVNVYESWMDNIVNSVIPFLSLLFLNISIYRRIRKARLLRQKMTQKEQNDVRLSMMLFCIVFIFFVCYAPSFFFGIAKSTGFDQHMNEKLPTLLHLTEGINSSVNVIVYSILCQTFRKMAFQVFCGKKRVRNGKPEVK